MAKVHGVAVPAFPAPVLRDPVVNENESQFRRDVERTFQDITAYIERVSEDPEQLALHVLADASGLGVSHTVSGLTAGQVLRAASATTAAFAALIAGDIGAGTFGAGNYVFPGTLKVTGTLFPDGHTTRDLGILSTNAWKNVYWSDGGVLKDDQGGSIELGHPGTTTGTPFIDFHSGAFTVDYDYRIISSGGTPLAGNATGTFHGSVHDFPIGGMVLGPATGGNKGTGTLNVSADVLKNNTPFTNPDYVFEEKFLGKDAGPTPRRAGWGLQTLQEKRAYVQQNMRFEAVRRGPMGVFERSELLLEVVEEQFLHICDLEDRVDGLLARVVDLETPGGGGGPPGP